MQVYHCIKSQGRASDVYQISRGLGCRRQFRDPEKFLSPTEILREIELDDSNMFAVTSPELGRYQSQGVSFYPMPLDGGFQRFAMGSTAPSLSPDDWFSVVHLIATMGKLMLARISSQKYSLWQNTTDPAIYEKNYGLTTGFRLVERGSPPVNRISLDTSLNPGRAQLLNKADVQVAAEMWLGPAFWQQAPCTKQEVFGSDLFIEKKDTPHYLYLKAWPEPFTRPDGEQGRVQQKLWRLLFHQDCEWPPGSGGISDTPVGGPPELK